MCIADLFPQEQSKLDFTKPQWDILLNFTTISSNQPGIETDGQFIYTTNWNGNTIYKYDVFGNFIENFTIPGVSYIRDLAFDGEYFYAGNTGMYIFKMDFTNQILMDTIQLQGDVISGVRHIAYDPKADSLDGGFWCGNWNDLALFNRDGDTLLTTTGVVDHVYGTAYDSLSQPGTSLLWLFSSNTQGSGVDIMQVNLNTMQLIDTIHPATDIPGFNNGLAGGLCASADIIPGKFVLMGNIQQTPNLVFGYELEFALHDSVPGMADSMYVIPGENGHLSASVSWSNPSTTISGSPLENLNSVDLLRHSEVIFTNPSPTIGNVTEAVDSVSTPGLYVYSIVGSNAYGYGAVNKDTAYIGTDVPAAPQNIMLSYNYETGYRHLSWTAPAVGLHNGYFLPDSTSFGVINIMNNDTLVWDYDSALNIIDTSIYTGNAIQYKIVSLNHIGIGGSSLSNSIYIEDPCIIREYFNDPQLPVGWYVAGNGQQNWIISNTNESGGDEPELLFNWAPSFSGESIILTEQVNISNIDVMELNFKHWFDAFSQASDPVTISILIPEDSLNWQAVWSKEVFTDNYGPGEPIVYFSNPGVGDSIRLGFGFEGNTYDLNGWYIDDVCLKDATYFTNNVDFFVFDSLNGLPIHNALIDINGMSKYTDTLGRTSFVLGSGDYTFKVMANGFLDFSGQFTMIDSDLEIEVEMSPVGINENLPLKFSLYPIPAKEILNIRLKNKHKNAKAVIYDANGRKVHVDVITHEKKVIDVSGFNRGMYYLKIITNSECLVRKIVFN